MKEQEFIDKNSLMTVANFAKKEGVTTSYIYQQIKNPKSKFGLNLKTIVIDKVTFVVVA